MRKILCIADIHGNIQELLRLREFAASSDIDDVIILGDFSGHNALKDRKENEEDVIHVLSIMSNFNLLCIPGNCDWKSVIHIFDRHGVNLHRKAVTVDDTVLIGLGGSNPTPFNTPFELTEEEIYEELKSLLRKNKNKKVILVLHCPPKNTVCDMTDDGMHVGSSAVRQIVEEFQPNLVLCSHVHESGGKDDRIGRSRIVNIGPISGDRVGILGIGDKIHLSFEKIRKR